MTKLAIILDFDFIVLNGYDNFTSFIDNAYLAIGSRYKRKPVSEYKVKITITIPPSWIEISGVYFKLEGDDDLL